MASTSELSRRDPTYGADDDDDDDENEDNDDYSRHQVCAPFVTRYEKLPLPCPSREREFLREPAGWN